MIAGARLAVHVGLAPVRPWHLPLTMTLLDSINALETIIAAKFLAYAVGVFIDFLISHSNAHLSYTRNDKDLCDVVWVDHMVDQKSALTSVSANEILNIA